MTDRYYVIGNPIEHSLSPMIQSAFAKALGEDMCYEKRLFELGAFQDSLRILFSTPGVKGANVTVPFKREALRCADHATERAMRAGAANTLKLEDGVIYADNTDGEGFIADVEKRLQFPLKGKRILIIGAGGAARGLLAALVEKGSAEIAVANRTQEKAQRLAEAFSVRALTLDETAEASWDLIVNATSASMAGEAPKVSVAALNRASLCYDLFYAKKPTPFLTKARQSGEARLADGLGMLVEQAAVSFYFWRKKLPETQLVYEMLR